jgi:hypothetical protein
MAEECHAYEGYGGTPLTGKYSSTVEECPLLIGERGHTSAMVYSFWAEECHAYEGYGGTPLPKKYSSAVEECHATTVGNT